jgi:hypothetical protein
MNTDLDSVQHSCEALIQECLDPTPRPPKEERGASGGALNFLHHGVQRQGSRSLLPWTRELQGRPFNDHSIPWQFVWNLRFGSRLTNGFP